MPKPKQRRARGQGEYWQSKDGRHHWRITIRGHAYEVADQDPERAKARFADLKAQLQAKVDVVGGRQSYRTFMERYLDTVVRPETRKASTFADYCKRAGLYVLPTLGDYRLDALTLQLGQAWVNAMVEHGYAHSSIKQALSLAKRSLDRAVQERLIAFNPFASLKNPAAPAQDIDDDEEEQDTGRVMTPAQIEAFLKIVQGDWLEPLYRLALSLGLRRGELLGLRWADYDKEKMVLRIRQQVVQIDGKIHITPPKTRKSRRSVPILDWHVDMLDRHKVQWMKRKLKAGPVWKENDLIFASLHGTPIEPSNLLRRFHRDLEKASLADLFRFHDLRHTASQVMKDAGVDAKVRAAVLGHAGVQITEQVYSHVSPEAMREAIRKASG